MRLNNNAITNTKRVKSVWLKLPHFVKIPSNNYFSFPNSDHCLFLLWTILRASYAINTLYPFSTVSSECSSQKEKRTLGPLYLDPSLTPSLPQRECRAPSWESKKLLAKCPHPPLPELHFLTGFLVSLQLYYSVGQN